MLTDFGLSKEGMFEKTLTQTMLGGGQSYQLPEVIREQPYEKSVDLYLLGLLAYEMVEGKTVFNPNQEQEALTNKIMNCEFEMPK